MVRPFIFRETVNVVEFRVLGQVVEVVEDGGLRELGHPRDEQEMKLISVRERLQSRMEVMKNFTVFLGPRAVVDFGLNGGVVFVNENHAPFPRRPFEASNQRFKSLRVRLSLSPKTVVRATTF
jgi:hypothetical protein